MAGSARAALDQRDVLEELVRLDRLTVVRADLDVDADHVTVSHRLAEGRVEDERAAVRDPRLDDDVRLDAIDGLLDADHVLGELDHRASEPAEAVDVLHVPPDSEPGIGDDLERLRVREREHPRVVSRGGHGDRGALVVDRDLYCLPPSRWLKPSPRVPPKSGARRPAPRGSARRRRASRSRASDRPSGRRAAGSGRTSRR